MAAAAPGGRGTRPLPLWLDCDPGHDDALAILLAAHSPALQLLGVSTVASNQTVGKTTRNALDVLDVIGRGGDVGVVRGQAKPLMRAALLCPEIHGDTGLDGPAGGPLLPHCGRAPLPGLAVNVMHEAISRAAAEEEAAAAAAAGDAGVEEEQDGSAADDAGPAAAGAGGGEGAGVSVIGSAAAAAAAAATAAAAAAAAASNQGDECSSGQRRRRRGRRVQLVCTGALTNAALLLTLYPELVDVVDVTIMGGAIGVGNTGPVQEFNIQTDPEAAKIVFEAGAPLTMVPLEVTHTALATRDVLARLLAGGGGASSSSSSLPPSSSPSPSPSPFRVLVQQLLAFFEATYREVFGFLDGPPLHDPCAVAAVIDPSLFSFELMRVDVECTSALSAGQTVCDVWHQSTRPKNCRVARRMDVGRFWDLLLAAVDAADAAAPMNRCGAGGGSGGGGEGVAAAE